MEKKEKNKRPRWWTAQRSYYYESHDADGNFNGLTVEEWKKRILVEWDARRLKAYHATIIFHDKDSQTDDHGNITTKDLHAHLCVWFIDGHTPTSAMKATGCSRVENVEVIKKNKKASAYKYLLHITEKAVKDKKYIYGEAELIISKSSPDIKYDFHKLIQKSEEEEAVEEVKDIKKKLLQDIIDGEYDEDTMWWWERYPNINKIIASDMKIAHLIGSSQSYRREVENAIKVRNAIIAQQNS